MVLHPFSGLGKEIPAFYEMLSAKRVWMSSTTSDGGRKNGRNSHHCVQEGPTMAGGGSFPRFPYNVHALTEVVHFGRREGVRG